ERISSTIAKAFISWLQPQIGNLTVRIGTPSFIPLEGQESGAQIIAEIPARSFIATRSFCGEELPFIAQSHYTWSTFADAGMHDAPNIQFYSHELDCCLAYEIHTQPSNTEKASDAAKRDVMLRGWGQSVFALIPEWKSWPYVDIPEPHQHKQWPWDHRM